MAPRGENRAAKSALRAPTMAAISHPLPLYRLLPFLFVAKTLAKAKRRLPPAAKEKRCLGSAVRRVAVEWVAAVPSWVRCGYRAG